MRATSGKMCLSSMLGGICGSLLALLITVLVVTLSVTQIVIEALMEGLTYGVSLVALVAVKGIRTAWTMLLFMCGLPDPLGLSVDAIGYVNIDSVELSDATQKLGEVGPVSFGATENKLGEVGEAAVQKIEAKERLDAVGGVVG